MKPVIGNNIATDQGYRVIIGSSAGEVMLPAANQSWQLEYKFIVPPIPQGDWEPTGQVFYVWGDVDFDEYGSFGPYQISPYMFNQVAPQVMIGNCLSSNDPSYKPSWQVFDTWVMQAQYFWMKDNNTPYAICGEFINVDPGDELTTKISYDSSTGQITASISGPGGTSSVVASQPFPDQPGLFASWSDFFTQAQAASGTTGVWSQPVLNVESHYVNELTLCSVLPFQVNFVSIPGIPWMLSSYTVSQSGTYSCSNALTVLRFYDLSTDYWYRLCTTDTGADLSMDQDPVTKQPLMSASGNYTGQFWKLTPWGDGTFRATTLFTGDQLSLSVTKDTKQPCMAASANDNEQHWQLLPLGGGLFQLHTLYTGEQLSLSQQDDKSKLCMANTGDDNRQRWFLTPIQPI